MNVKKWLMLLSLIITSGTIQASMWQPCSPVDFCCDMNVDGCHIHIDWLAWKARKCGLDYLWPSDITRYKTVCGAFSTETAPKINGAVTTLGKGKPKTIDQCYDSGVRVGIFKQCGCWDIGLRYTYFDTDNDDSWKVGDGIPYTPSRMHPDIKGFVDRINVDKAYSRYDLELNQIDIEARSCWMTNDEYSLMFFSGFKYASIEEELKTSYYGLSIPRQHLNGGSNSLNSKRYHSSTDKVDRRKHDVRESVDMDSYGPYVGLEGNWNLGCCFNVFGRASCGLFAANFERSFKEREATALKDCDPLFDDEILVHVRDDHWCGVKYCELAFGLDYHLTNFCCAHWHLQVGYEFQHWDDMRSFLQFTDHHEKGVNVRATDSLMFDGVFVRLHTNY